ncbi:GNAT family N-acetyltransferase [Halalkalibacter sp. APA_J-10(15)]|uniref:GNAT family N-acetyltransferase n=1 Tax=Halalkalibacter sp. APA_J-10(15) TaxID=2933805 RepID=UPI001FF6C853|nr:GNAT family N-acetyltransferase [Halalkalibacter sp. APA_J-10(15)]MCK0473231.1 GNAT family N-acetyltransferase [Halalkalibacter sp. APA_J-10(15)]
MAKNIQIKLVEESEKSVLKQLIEFYEYDFSEFNNHDVNKHGYYGYRYFDHYWTEDDRVPLFITVDEKIAGFVLINDYCYVLKEKPSRSIAEFFVMRKYRKQGIGTKVAYLVFDRFKGNWEVLVHPENRVSFHFWKNVIEDYTQGDFLTKEVTTEEWAGTGYIFSSDGKSL